jgi:hypothetical protein
MMPQASTVKKLVNGWAVAIAVCAALLLLRSWFFLAWEESYFSSDQSIVGLMAKHLAEGRAKPLFYYGQEYQLAVEAWIAAPFIASFGTSVATLRTVLVLLNLATGLLLMRLLVTDAALSIWSAAAASAFFWIAPAAAAASLVETSGGNIEPFFWALILWLVRNRPLALGVCLALAFLNREFSLYAAPMLMAAHLVESRGQRRALAMNWLASAASFLIVFTVVQTLKPLADLTGPGTAGLPIGTAGQDTFGLMLQRVAWSPSQIPERLNTLLTEIIPALLGFKTWLPAALSIGSDVVVGWETAGLVVAALLAIALGHLALEISRSTFADRRWLFPLYLIGIGTLALGVYPLTRPVTIVTVRYVLLVIYVPIGVAALLLQRGRHSACRWLAITAITIFATCSAVDHVRILTRARLVPPPAPMREIASRLEARGVRVALADYWRAYIITYLSGETIKVASTNFERITEYLAIAGRPLDGISPGGAVMIQLEPCAVGGERVGGWYLCDW